MIRIAVWLVCLGFICCISVHGAGNDAPKDGSALAAAVVKAYREAKTYRAVWHGTHDWEPGKQDHSHIEVALDRDGPKVLFLISKSRLHGGLKPSEGGLLSVNNGQELISATLLPGKPAPDPEKIKRPAPKPFTIRDAREMAPFVPQTDLYLVVGGEQPFEYLFQARPLKYRELGPAPDDKALRPRLEISPPRDNPDEMSVLTLTLNPITHFIEEARWTKEGRTHTQMRFGFSADQPLDDNLFDFAEQASRLEPAEGV